MITTRIAYMVAQDIPAENILAVTFTNKAANEMRERVGGLISTDDSKAVSISTFHSLCVKLLRRNIDRLGYKRNFGIYAGADQLGLVRKILTRIGGKDCSLDPKVALSMIGKSKNMGTPLSKFSADLIHDVYAEYQDQLKMLNVVDFDDLLIMATKLLDEQADVREYWQETFPYIMVDEFQDTNSLQMKLLRNLAGTRKNVCVVGDDDQSIYGWRGADISNILDFERFFENPKVVKLEENYRCPMPVLQLSNSIIKLNKNRREKTLWSAKKTDQRVRLIGLPSAEEEAQMIVEEMLGISQSETRPWEDFAILFRMNAQSRLMEQAMREQGIPYRVVGGMSFFDRREIKDFMSYLMVLLNPSDDVNLLRVINNPPRGIGASTIKAATDFSKEHGISVWDALRSEDFQGTLSKKAQEAIAKFADLLKTYGQIAQTPSADYAEMASNLVKEIEMVDYLRRTCKTAEEANMREQNLYEFIESIHDHRARRKKAGLQHFLDEVALTSEREDDDISKKKGVCLITLHAAKGLEFPIVFLIGLEEGILPHSRSLEEGTKDEERRLLYVGMTRAMEHLTLSYCVTRRRYGDLVTCEPSSFIKEFDMEYVEEINYDEIANEPATEESAADHFERIKALLAAGSKG